MEAIRLQQEEFETLRNIEISEVQRLEVEIKRKAQEKERRIAQENKRVEDKRRLEESIAARAFSNQFLGELHVSVFDMLQDQGHFYDPVKKEIEVNFMGGLISNVVTAANSFEVSLHDRTNRSVLVSYIVVISINLVSRLYLALLFASDGIPFIGCKYHCKGAVGSRSGAGPGFRERGQGSAQGAARAARAGATGEVGARAAGQGGSSRGGEGAPGCPRSSRGRRRRRPGGGIRMPI